MTDSIAKVIEEMREFSDPGGPVPQLKKYLSWIDRLAALDGWRPMKELPNDGTVVMISVPEETMPVMCRADDYWYGRKEDGTGFADWLDGAKGWMPLPTPPKETP